MNGAGVALLQVKPDAAAQTGRQTDALQLVVAGGCIEPFIQTFGMQLHKAGLVQLNQLAMQVQQLAAQQGAVHLGGGGDKSHRGVSGVEMVFAHGAATAGGNEFTREEYSFLFQCCHGSIGAHQTQPQRGRNLRTGCLPVLLHETGDSCLGIHNLIKLPKKV